MTLQELSQLYHLREEIKEDERRLAELEARAYAASSPNLSGSFGGCVRDRFGDYAEELSKCRSIIKEKQERCIKERLRIEEYICGIPDSHTRRIFSLRFVDGLSWFAVARCIGGNSTEDGVKKICYRYLFENN